MRIGFLEVMWQLGDVEDNHLVGMWTGIFFPTYTFFADFVMVKDRWRNIIPKLNPLELSVVEQGTMI